MECGNNISEAVKFCGGCGAKQNVLIEENTNSGGRESQVGVKGSDLALNEIFLLSVDFEKVVEKNPVYYRESFLKLLPEMSSSKYRSEWQFSFKEILTFKWFWSEKSRQIKLRNLKLHKLKNYNLGALGGPAWLAYRKMYKEAALFFLFTIVYFNIALLILALKMEFLGIKSSNADTYLIGLFYLLYICVRFPQQANIMYFNFLNDNLEKDVDLKRMEIYGGTNIIALVVVIILYVLILSLV